MQLYFLSITNDGTNFLSFSCFSPSSVSVSALILNNETVNLIISFIHHINPRNSFPSHPVMKLSSTKNNGAKNKLPRDKALKTGRLLKVTREKIGRTLKWLLMWKFSGVWRLMLKLEKLKICVKETQWHKLAQCLTQNLFSDKFSWFCYSLNKLGHFVTRCYLEEIFMKNSARPLEQREALLFAGKIMLKWEAKKPQPTPNADNYKLAQTLPKIMCVLKKKKV